MLISFLNLYTIFEIVFNKFFHFFAVAFIPPLHAHFHSLSLSLSLYTCAIPREFTLKLILIVFRKKSMRVLFIVHVVAGFFRLL